MTPSISSARLSLRQLTKATSRNLRWLRDPEVMKFSEQRHREHNISSQLRYISSFGGNSHLWGIYLVEDGEHIGNIGTVRDEPNNVAEVGMMIGESQVWGKGYGKEAWIAACNWLLDVNHGAARKLEAGCARSNVAMLKIIQGSGFTEEGERKLRFVLDGGPVGAVLFGRFK